MRVIDDACNTVIIVFLLPGIPDNGTLRVKIIVTQGNTVFKRHIAFHPATLPGRQGAVVNGIFPDAVFHIGNREISVFMVSYIKCLPLTVPRGGGISKQANGGKRLLRVVHKGTAVKVGGTRSGLNAVYRLSVAGTPNGALLVIRNLPDTDECQSLRVFQLDGCRFIAPRRITLHTAGRLGIRNRI